MQVILREDVPNVGRTGQVVNVRDGFGRNYLIPRGLAVLATDRNVREIEHQQRVIAQREAKLMKDANAVKTRLDAISVTIAKQVGAEEKLFGSVTAKEIADAISAQGVPVDRRLVQLEEPIKSLGIHNVKVKLARDIIAEPKVWVVAKN